MNVLKIMMVFLILIMSIGVVCAEDAICDDIVSSDCQEDLETSQDAVCGVGQVKTFTDLASDIENSTDVLEMKNDYRFNNESDKNESISINKDNFVINGNGRTIDGNNQTGIFIINATNITVNNLIFINANSARGSVFNIKVNCSLTTNNVTFRDDSSTECAIVFVRGQYTSNDDKFIDVASADYGVVTAYNADVSINHALMMSSRPLRWGFVFNVENCSLSVFNSTFANTTSKYTTAVMASASTKIKNCTFVNLHSTISAGAIGAKGMKKCEIDGCTFINVTSEKNAGAVFADDSTYIESSLVLINNSNFIDCYSGFGGAIMQLGGALVVENCNFTNNCALFDGGAIYVSDALVTVSYSMFEECRAQYNAGGRGSFGGAIFSDYNGFDLVGCELKSCSAQYGGAVYIYDSNYYIVNNTFYNNSVLNGSYNDIFTVFDGVVDLDNNTFSSNDTLSMDNVKYETIINASGMKLILKNRTIDVVNLPSRFDLRDWGWDAPVRDQGHMGACWAFGASGAIESVILENLGIEMDISKNNMQNALLEYYPYGIMGFYEGGNLKAASTYALSWFGVFPSGHDTYDELGKISPIIAADDSIHFQDVIFIPPLQNMSEGDCLKRAVLKYGALAVCVQIVQAAPYYDDARGTVYCNDSSHEKHAVTLIGWDDNYSASNFLSTPPGDGAWIIKNSWGTIHGDEGYCYISYYDPSFATCSVSVAYLLENTVEYNKNYQYDIGGNLVYNYSSNEYANIFAALEDDLIAGVGTYFDSADVEYVVEVYVNNVLRLNQSGISPFSGFHTIKLDSYVPVKEGDIFIVKINSNAVPFLFNSRQHYIEGTSQYVVNDTWINASDIHVVCSIKAYTVCDDTKIIDNHDVSVDYDGGKYFSVKIVTADGHAVGAGENVTFTINKKTIVVPTDDKGIAKIKINDVPKKYGIITVYRSKIYRNTVTVKQVLKASKVSVKKSAKSFALKATLKINGKLVKGKKITFLFKGKTYTAKTNSKGIAKAVVKKNVIKKLKKGKTYTVKVTYLKDTIKSAVKVSG